MSAPYRFELWICERCNTKGTSEKSATAHYDHPAGWKLGGNQHPEVDRFDPDHPDKVKGFFWTVNWKRLRAELRRGPAGSQTAVSRPLTPSPAEWAIA